MSFTYPGNPKPILEKISFSLRPSERVALVGENGEGKTTIVKLLTRLYDPTGGQILLDGMDLREYDVEDLWKEIGVVFQDFVKYEMTASDNIAVGRLAARDDAGFSPPRRGAARKKSSSAFPRDTSRFSVRDSRGRSTFQPASGNGSTSPVHICAMLSYWFSLLSIPV